MGRVVWTVAWLLPAEPHPVVVWEVVVNIDCGVWSHRDGFPGVVWSGLVVSGWDGGVVPVAVGSWVGLLGPWGGSSRSYHTPSLGRVGGRGQHRLWDVVTPGRIPRRGLVCSGLVWWCLGGTVGWFRLRWAHGSGCLDLVLGWLQDMGPLWRPRTRITRLGASVWQQAGDIDSQSSLRASGIGWYRRSNHSTSTTHTFRECGYRSMHGWDLCGVPVLE